MKNFVLSVTFSFLFLNIINWTEAADPDVIQYKVDENLQLKCNISANTKNITWSKDGQTINLKGPENAVLELPKENQNRSGTYACFTLDDGGNEISQTSFHVIEHVFVKLPESISVVEEDKLSVECLVKGNVTTVKWIFQNKTYPTDDPDEGITVKGEYFYIKEAKESHRGNLTCIAYNDYLQEKSPVGNCLIRVKGKYAALWPFLGICAEVIILCAIIVVYEKKRNKSDPEESDTDQSPDQKNTPDHGKDPNLRHRQ